MISPQEADCFVALYTAGAHSEAIAQVFGRDPRSVRATLRREGVTLRREPPLPADWRQGLPAPVQQAIAAYLAALDGVQQAAWQRVQQTALTRSPSTYVFPSLAAYQAVLATVQPPETPSALACRLGIDLTRVLLAYAARATHTPPGPTMPLA
jgi:hypothetical protein